MQLILPLACPAYHTKSNWWVGEHNIDATRMALDEAPLPFLWIWGDKASGKTHLANLWAQRHHGTFFTFDTPYHDLAKNSAVVLEDIDTCEDETSLFHFYNAAKEAKACVLLTARTPPAYLSFKLPDLVSRLKTIPLVNLGQPGDAELLLVLTQQLKNRGIKMKPYQARYMLNRIERSMKSLRYWLKIIEGFEEPLSLSMLKKIGIEG